MEQARIDRGEMKEKARRAMRGRHPSAFLVALVFVLVVMLLQELSTRLQYPNLDLDALESYIEWGDYDAAMEMFTEQPSFPAQLLNMAVILMRSILGIGFSWYCLNAVRGVKDAGFGELFDPFGYFFKAVGLTLLMGVLVLLWTLLFIVPGIIAAYRYSMAYYILMDDPDKPITECLRESKSITSGHKGELFLLDLSFLGWYLLSMIPFVSVYTNPYFGMTRANYYCALSGREEAPVHIDYSV